MTTIDSPTGLDVPWDGAFETALRDALPDLVDIAVLTPDLELRGVGMDSLATLRVLLGLEDTYGISVPDECLTSSTFATPAALWGAVGPLVGRAAA